jgi:exo-beta-1,3-glucanase (GH17 family)
MNLRFASSTIVAFWVTLSMIVAFLVTLSMNMDGIFWSQEPPPNLSAREFLGNPDFMAISFGGFRHVSQGNAPTVEDLKEDLRIMSALGIKVLRTFKTQKNPHAANLLEAIKQLRTADPQFEMYVMLGVWIDCQRAWTGSPNHEAEDKVENRAEIETAVKLANQYPESVKVIAVGNEAMVHWASGYFVRPKVILNWVRHLQEGKKSGRLPSDLWITCSDNFEAWGGGDPDYHTDDLRELIRAVDYVSLHTYSFQDSFYSTDFFRFQPDERSLTVQQKADRAVERAVNFAISQYQQTAKFIHSIDPDKPVHIGETGWASRDNLSCGENGSGAADEYKQKLYYEGILDWTRKKGISCFFFEAFDEPWKNARNQGGCENHFGLFTVDGQAKFAIWAQVDGAGLAKLKRGDSQIKKTYDGDEKAVIADILGIPAYTDIQHIDAINDHREIGQPVTEATYVVCRDKMKEVQQPNVSLPSARVNVVVWGGSCLMKLLGSGTVSVATSGSQNQWWGGSLVIEGNGRGENLSQFAQGKLNFEIRGPAKARLSIGFQTGLLHAGTQTNNQARFADTGTYQLSEDWKSYSIPLEEINQQADLADVTNLLFLRGDGSLGGATIEVRNIYYSR